jgi:hypothetical protein
MPSDPKQTPTPESPSATHREKGVVIFTYSKIIFMFPTMIVALICGIGMSLAHDQTSDPLARPAEAQASGAPAIAQAPREGDRAASTQAAAPDRHRRFTTPQNLLGVLFLTVFAFNLLIMGLEFPRFSIVGVLLLVLSVVFFFLWLGAYFDLDLLRPVRAIMGSIYVASTAAFYYAIVLIMAVLFLIIYFTRYLDYWEILPNEILHHHGPLSDLERLPTLNLKFDKEIPDVLEYLLLGAGRLVLHVTEERKAIVLDNVLSINSKEKALKELMSRLEVRVTTDQEVDER